MKTWLLFDCPYILHRAFHSVGDLKLSHKGLPTATLYGFFQAVKSCMDRFATQHAAFAFDSHPLLRKAFYPGYKMNRASASHDITEREKRRAIGEAFTRLRTDLLSFLGVPVLEAKGYEADDCIASAMWEAGPGVATVIVSADKDFYQLLRFDDVLVYHPRTQEVVTAKSYSKATGMKPDQIVKMKALAGCSSDNVRGVEGIGEGYATQFLLGKLKPGSKAWTRCQAPGVAAIIERNRKLIELPWEGCPAFRLDGGPVNPAKWKRLMGQLGMETLR